MARKASDYKRVGKEISMNDIAKNLAPVEPVSAMSTSALVDEVGLLNALIADAEKKKKAMVSELLTRANGDKYLDGELFTATIVAASISWSLDGERIKEQMGQKWVQQFSKMSMRSAFIRVASRKEH